MFLFMRFSPPPTLCKAKTKLNHRALYCNWNCTVKLDSPTLVLLAKLGHTLALCPVLCLLPAWLSKTCQHFAFATSLISFNSSYRYIKLSPCKHVTKCKHLSKIFFNVKKYIVKFKHLTKTFPGI